MFIDAMGKACPTPVILAKKALSEGCADLSVAVDNAVALGNLMRLGNSMGIKVVSEEKDAGYVVHFQAAAQSAPQPAPQREESSACNASTGYCIFIGKDYLGEGEEVLGRNLMKMALYTLSQEDEAPACILFMNSGVKLPAGEEVQVLDSLTEMIAKGTEVLVCGTCLNFYGLEDQLKLGTVSNMYDILFHMRSAAKVISF
ncbi:MAG: sulfurtransferase-like selenium metabolism protein YedF [Bacillota bacterium]|nr:sulfurtransferase-like selenium metabolism protein YedF [Bacillota bacterium]